MKPGKFLVFEHGGDLEKASKSAGCKPEEIIDFSNLSISPEPPPGLEDYLKSKIVSAFRHPSSGETLRKKIADKLKIEPDQVLIGAGTTEFIRFLPLVKRPRRPVILGPTYGDYEPALRMVDAVPRYVTALEAENFEFPRYEWEKMLGAKPDWIILARPNNPIGQNWPLRDLLQAMENHPETFFVVDETCLEISENPGDSFIHFPLLTNLAILRSFSKTYAVPGLRLGYMVVPAKFSGHFRKLQIPWSPSALALEAGAYLLSQDKWLSEVSGRNLVEKNRVCRKLSKLRNYKVFPSSITAFTVKGTTPGFDSRTLQKSLLEENRMLIRTLESHEGLGSRFFRIGLRTPPDNDRLLAALQQRDGP